MFRYILEQSSLHGGSRCLLHYEHSALVGKILAVVDAVFALLVILGIVVDPTTAGVADSARAMTYVEPWEDPKAE